MRFRNSRKDVNAANIGWRQDVQRAAGTWQRQPAAGLPEAVCPAGATGGLTVRTYLITTVMHRCRI